MGPATGMADTTTCRIYHTAGNTVQTEHCPAGTQVNNCQMQTEDSLIVPCTVFKFRKVCGKIQAGQFCVCHLCCVTFHALIFNEFSLPSAERDGTHVVRPNIPHSPCKKEV